MLRPPRRWNDIGLPHGPWYVRLGVALTIVLVIGGLIYGICGPLLTPRE